MPRRPGSDLPWTTVVVPTAALALLVGATLPLALGAGLLVLVFVRWLKANGPAVEAAPSPPPPRLRVLPPVAPTPVPIPLPRPSPRTWPILGVVALDVPLELTPALLPRRAPITPIVPPPRPVPATWRVEEVSRRARVDASPIEDARVMPGIGPGVVASLRSAGIRTLGDVTRARLARVRGVGPWRTRQLLAWVALRRG